VTQGSNCPSRLFWAAAFATIAIYVAVRMGVFALSAEVPLPAGNVVIPNTFASVDHPFHVARADTLWRTLGEGRLLRWIAQHQGGYPVEFYPLGEAWLEVFIRAISLGTLTAQGAHSIAVIAIFLLPGVSFWALAREDGRSAALAFLTMALHISLPGSWYDGGYTELVQWGLATNVAGAVAACLMFPWLIRYLRSGEYWAAALSATFAALAVYCNPRSLVGLAALGVGAYVAAFVGPTRVSPRDATVRLALVASCGALLAAPELGALVRFGGLYHFVQFSGYAAPSDYLTTSINAVSGPILVLALTASVYALVVRRRQATCAAGAALIVYIALTIAVAFVPAVSRLASQLEPTRLMPLQRLLTLYLGATAVWAAFEWLGRKLPPRYRLAPTIVALVCSVAFVAVQTRPLVSPPPDPASPAVPAVSLYPVAMSARPEQADLEAAIRAADAAAAPGTALLILGSALSWHQQLWAPLWTSRPLFYDNWLWYWHPYHAGTPGYLPQAGHHYPDPERALEARYLARHSIGAVLVTGDARATAAASPRLVPLRQGTYDVFLVEDPITTVTFGDMNVTSTEFGNQQIEAIAAAGSEPVVVRANWFPRWVGTSDERTVVLTRRRDGDIEISQQGALRQLSMTYQLQPPDWVARGLAAIGVASVAVLLLRSIPSVRAPRRWYPPLPKSSNDGLRNQPQRVTTGTGARSTDGST
jgi:hypothetical protein